LICANAAALRGRNFIGEATKVRGRLWRAPMIIEQIMTSDSDREICGKSVSVLYKSAALPCHKLMDSENPDTTTPHYGAF